MVHLRTSKYIHKENNNTIFTHTEHGRRFSFQQCQLLISSSKYRELLGDKVSPEVGAGSVVGLSTVEEKRETVLLWGGVQGEGGGEGDGFTHETDSTVRYSV